ncbi:MAG: serine/threonine-protein kinase, partial [Polyangiales bacterium]
RDLKPANLFVLDDPTRSPPLLVKVLDFGVSKVRRDDFGDDAALTRSTAFLGTPLYMAPEQVRTSRDVDTRADVWAFGCILHELVTGEAPFRRRSLGETCAAILVEEPPKLPSTVSRPLAAIVARCLAKDPGERYADAAALAGALAPLCSPGTREEIRRTLGVDTEIAREKKPVWPWAALALVLAAAGFAWHSRAPAPNAASPTSTASAPVAAPSPSMVVPIVEPSSVSAPASAKPSSAPTFVPPRPKPSVPSASVAASTSASAAPVVSAPAPTASALNPEFGGRI